MANEHDPFAPQDPAVFEARSPRGKTAATQEPDVDETTASVPKGTRAEVLDWVGDDKDRAKLALAAEEATGKPRKGVVDDLKDLLNP